MRWDAVQTRIVGQQRSHAEVDGKTRNTQLVSSLDIGQLTSTGIYFSEKTQLLRPNLATKSLVSHEKKKTSGQSTKHWGGLRDEQMRDVSLRWGFCEKRYTSTYYGGP